MNRIFSFLPAVVLGGLLVLAFEPFNFFIIPFIIFPCLFFILKKTNAPWLNAFLFGFSFFSIGLYWLILCIVNYGGASWFSALTLCLLFYIFLGLFFLPFALIKKNAFAHAIILLILLEIIREYLFTGFPWLSLGFSQVSNPLINQYFSVIGSHGITMIILLISALSFKVIEHKNKKVIPVIGIFIIILLNFMLSLTQPQPDNETKLKISLLQGNVSQDIKWNQDTIMHQIESYLDLLDSAKGDLIVFPETAIPLLYANYPSDFLQRINQKIKTNKTIILGSILEIDGNYLNSAVIKNDKEDQFYFKQHLVPFGEYFPLSNYLGFVYRKILNIPFSNLTPSKIENELIAYDNFYLGLNICYEDIFKASYDEFLPQANLFINLTNDAWYDRSPAAHQHIQIAQARAMEFNRPIVRATNTGVTAYINNKGKIINSLPTFSRDILEIEVIPKSLPSLFSKFGYFPLYILLLMIALCDKFKSFPLLNSKKKVKSQS